MSKENPMSIEKAISLVEQTIDENKDFYRKDVLEALEMSVDALRIIGGMTAMIDGIESGWQ